jgi:hypothetical protein
MIPIKFDKQAKIKTYLCCIAPDNKERKSDISIELAPQKWGYK